MLKGFVMRSRWLFHCLLAATSLSVGCYRAEPTPQTVATPTPPMRLNAEANKSDLVLVHQEVLSEEPRIRLHLTMLLLEMQVPTEGLQPFSTELPDLFGTDEACRVVATDELWALIAKLQQKQIVRHPPKQIIDVASASAGTWRTEWPHDHHDGTVTPTVEVDGVIRVELIPPRRKDNRAVTPATAVESLRVNETLVVSEPAEKSGSVQVSRVPVLGDLPIVGEELFTSRGKPRHFIKKRMYLVSCEAMGE